MGLFDDPKQTAQLMFAAGLLSGKGSFNQILGNSAMGAMDAYQNASLFSDRQKMNKAQMRQIEREEERQRQIEEAAKASYLSPASQAMQMGGGPTTQAAQAMPGLQPQFDQNGFAHRMMGIDPLMALKLMQKEKQDSPFAKIDPSGYTPESLAAFKATGDHSVLRAAPKQEASSLSRLLAERDALPPGHPMRSVYNDAIRKATTHQPATSVQVGLMSPQMVTDPTTGQQIWVQPPNKPGASPQPLVDPKTNKPYGVPPDKTGQKPPTEFQAKAGLYFKSMEKATETLARLEKVPSMVMPPPQEAALAANPTLANIATSKTRQSYVQAQRQWIDSINRVRSGANLPEMEYGRAVMTFFPQFGDDLATIQQKAAARAQEEQAMRAAAGPALGGEQGNVVDFGSLK